jgi:hypothetical protein
MVAQDFILPSPPHPLRAQHSVCRFFLEENSDLLTAVTKTSKIIKKLQIDI